MHPILESLNGTQDQWLVDLLFAFNRGDLEKFDNVKTLWTQQVFIFIKNFLNVEVFNVF